MNLRGSPGRVLFGQTSDQTPDFLRDRRPPAARSRPPTPVQTKTGAVPADDGFRLHDDEEVGPPRAETAQRSPEQPIKGVQRWARPLALQYGDLLAQGEHLERGIPTTAQEDPDRGQEGEDQFEHDSTFVT